jgi:hypothetical protein
MGEWYVTRQGQQMGPFTAGQLKQMAGRGEIDASDLVWKQGMTKWAPASQVKGLLEGVTGESASAGRPGRAAESKPDFSQPDKDAGPLGGASGSPDKEPWFYDFLTTYTKIFMYLGIAGLAVLLLASLVPTVIMVWTMMGQGVSGALIGIFLGLVSLVSSLLFLAIALLVLFFQVSLLLLAVDVGRNIRAIRKNTSGRER